MDIQNPTTKQVIIFTIVLSFITSVIGTILALGTLGPIFGLGEKDSGPLFFNKPTQKIIEKEQKEKILRQDELVVKVVEEVSPAVVSIIATKDVPIIEKFYLDPFANDPFFKQFFGDEGFGIKIPQFREKGTRKEKISSGSGFIVSADGLIITNKHVVADTEAEYTVILNDGRKIPAKVLARDPLQDLAILKAEGSGFKTIRLGNSSAVKIGQTVIAIGNALGEFSNTVSVGVVSGLRRSVVAVGGATGPENLQELIQTDAAINPGNSGGPLLNLRGEVIGINTAMARGAENIGFAIPINKAKRALEDIKTHGKIIYPFLGIRYIIVTKDFAAENKLPYDYGVLLQSGKDGPAVVPGSPAEKAGLKEGDLILELNGEKITPDSTLSTLILKYKVGDEVTIKFFRSGKEMETKAKLAERT